MSTVQTYPHIIVDEGGVARIADTRYKVNHLAAEHYQHGWTAEELLRQHPDLRPEQVYSALAYFYDHYKATVAEILGSAQSAELARDPLSLTRNELLKRRPAGSQ